MLTFCVSGKRRRPVGLCCWLFLFTFSTVSLTAPKISSIALRNNSYFSERELLDILSLKANSSFTQELLRQSLEELTLHYRRNGFYFFGIDSVQTVYSEDSSFVSLLLALHEGKQALLSQFSVQGNRVFPDNIVRAQFETSTGSVLRQEVLEKDIRSVLDFYSNNGYPFTKIHIDSVLLDSSDYSRLQITLTVEEGPKVYLTEVHIAGNTATKFSVIAREARLVPFEPYRQEKINRIHKRLERMQIFSSVDEPQLYVTNYPASDSAIGGLLFTVQEGSTNTFDGIIGYVPAATENGSGYFTGNFLVSMRNIFGTGRKLTARWQRETETTQELEAQYFEPWIFDIPFGIGLAYYQRKQDSTYVKNKIDLRGEYTITEELAFALSVSNESVYPSASLQQFTVFASDAWLIGGEIHYDTRDNFRNPTSGIRYNTTFQRGTKNITGPSEYLSLAPEKKFSVQKITVDAEVFYQIFPRNVTMLGLHGRQLTSSQIELSDMYQLGGTNTVRGYRENQFYGSAIVWSNVEYRFLMGRASNIFSFIDGGYFSKPTDILHGISYQEKFLYGYGIGARVESAVGIVSVSFALGKGDSFSNGKIHFGITNEF